MREKSMKDVNYYFVLKDQIKRMKYKNKKGLNGINSKPFSNGMIIEDSKED